MKLRGHHIKQFALVAISVFVMSMNILWGQYVSAQDKEVLRSQAKQLLSEKLNLPVAILEIRGERVEHLEYLGQELYTFIILNREALERRISDKPYYITLDSEGRRVNLEELEAQNLAAKKAKYGKLEPALYDHLQTIGPDETVNVSIWMAFEVEARQSPTEEEITTKGWKAIEEEDKVRRRRNEEGIKKFAEPIVAQIEAMGGKILYIDGLTPTLHALLTQSQIEAIAKRDDIRMVAIGYAKSGSYTELEGSIKISISEIFTEEKDGAHIFLKLATVKIYGCYNFQLNYDFKMEGNRILIELKNIFKPEICLPAEGPAVLSEDLYSLEGDYQLIIKQKGKEDNYNLKINENKIEINPVTSTFSVFGQPSLLFRVPANVIWISCGHYNRIGCEENQEYINICNRFFKESLISSLQHFDPKEGEYALSGFKAEGNKHFKIFGNVSKLAKLVESYSIYTSKNINDKKRCLLLSAYTWKGDFFYSWRNIFP